MTDLALTAWLLASIPLLVMAALLLYVVRSWLKSRKPRRLSKQVLMREGEAYLGRYREHKPRLTIHSIINRLVSKPLRMWQHDETGRICFSVKRPSDRWYEVKP